MSRTSGGTTTSFLYDGSQVQLEAQGATVTSVYSYGNSLTRQDGEFPMFDGHGSERTVTNSSQTVTGTQNLDAFEVQEGNTGSSNKP